MSIQLKPLVSAIVPAYNAEPFIRETLHSILTQTYPNLEVLVVDDGSKDRTSKIIEESASNDSRIKFFHQKNKGVAAARNLAIENSKGDYIAPIDADDVWYPEKIEKQVTRLEKYPAAGCAYTWSVSIDEKGKLLDAGAQWDLEGEVFQPLVLRNFVGNASVPVFRRSALAEVGGYNEQLRAKNAQGCEDWELCLRVAEKFHFCVVQEYLFAYRCYSESMSCNHEEMGRSYARVMDEIKKRHPEISRDIYRWSNGIFYLYLTNKSNISGDLRSSLKWLLKAVEHDAAVLTLPWVIRCLINRSLRMITYALTRNPQAWAQFRRKFTSPPPNPSFEKIFEESQARRVPEKLWDQIQLRRWAMITNNRSFSC
jgi:glycosyltransferase involved in cell wall biosynthesis